MTCERCGFQNPEGMRFCGGCGHRLADAAAEASRPGAATARPAVRETTQRRHMTVMFCDLVDSTPLAERLDPEDFREVLTHYRRVCLRAIERFGGYAALYAGDGLTVFFGYPRAHEDDAQRALHTGLAILDEIASSSAQLENRYGTALQVRIGVHSGVVIAEEVGGGAGEMPWQLDVSGEMPHVASRLESAAPPGSMVISDATRELVEGYFDTDSLGAMSLKGVSRPIGVHRVLRPTGAVGRLEVAAERKLSPLVGREEELTRLTELWRQAAAGHGCVVHLTGEAGIGKSRLVHELVERSQLGAATQRWQCSPHHVSTALYPVTTFLERDLELGRDDPPEQKLAALESAARAAELEPREAVPLLANVLSVGQTSELASHDVAARDARTAALHALEALLVANPARHPLVLVVDDLHWADPTTVELVGRIARNVGRLPVMCLLTFRSSFRPPWADASDVAGIELGPLAPTEVRQLASAASDKPLDADALDWLATTADGVPLFVEEMLKVGAPREAVVPPTLEGLLTERLDRLPELGEVIDVAAVLGREFDLSLLTAVAALDATDADDALAQLAEHDVLRPVASARSRCEFAHGLLQEAAYARILRRRRRALHASVAQLLLDRFPETVEREPELLARHWSAAEEPARAVEFWHRAGTRALERAAYLEAADHFSRGVDALDAAGAGGAEQQTDFLTHVGASLQAGKGYAAAGVEEAYARARSACTGLGDDDRLRPIIRGEWMLQLLRGEYATALELADEMLALAERGERRDALAEGHLFRGLVHMYLGAFELARTQLERAFDQHRRPERSDPVYEAQGDAGVGALAYVAVVLWNLGYVEESLDRSDLSLGRAHRVGGPVTRAQAWGMRAILHLSRSEPIEMAQWVRRTRAHSVDNDLGYWRTVSSLLDAWLRGRGGDPAGGLRRLEEELDAYVGSGSRLGLPHFHILRADLHRVAGDSAGALEQLRRGEDYIEQTGERFSESELFRFKGRVLATGERPDVAAAADAFARAVATAREQNAKLLELQAALRLAELELRTGGPSSARERVATLCDWFGPSSELPDVVRARALMTSETVAP